MKKSCISFIFVAIIFLIAILCLIPVPEKRTEYLRIHIRADSNDISDQNVKYKVKDAVVEFLTPYIAECDSKSKVENFLTDNLDQIEKTADRVLKDNGFFYTSKARLNNEYFPTRVYGELTLSDGYYDALIIELGSGKGDNWWCVVYPPLCFSGSGNNYIYKSKIKEIIDNFYKENK